jgi:replicative DNA helicase
MDIKGFTDIEAEQSLLGIFMINPSSVIACNWLNEEDFSEPLHGRIYEAINAEHMQGIDSTPITLGRKFANDPALKELENGDKYLYNLAKQALQVTPPSQIAKTLRECATKRKLYAICQATIAQLTETSGADEEPEKHLNDIIGELDTLQDGYLEKRVFSNKQVATQVFDDLKKDLKMFDTGLPMLNNAMGGGLFESKAYGLSARSGAGKTTMMITLADNLVRQDVRVLYLALEMGREQIMHRIIGRQIGYNPNAFVTPEARKDPKFQEKVASATHAMKENLFFLDMAGGNFGRIKTMMRSYVRRKKIDVVFIDYWQLIGGKGKENTSEHLDGVAQWFAEFAKQEKVALMMASQTNKEGNTRGSEGIKLAFDWVYDMKVSEINEDMRYMEALKTRYTAGFNVGDKNIPAFVLNPKGVYFEQIGGGNA